MCLVPIKLICYVTQTASPSVTIHHALVLVTVNIVHQI